MTILTNCLLSNIKGKELTLRYFRTILDNFNRIKLKIYKINTLRCVFKIKTINLIKTTMLKT